MSFPIALYRVTHKVVINYLAHPWIGYVGLTDDNQYIAWRLNWSLYTATGETPEAALTALLKERYPDYVTLKRQIREVEF